MNPFSQTKPNLASKAPLASPTFTGTPAAPTAADNTSTTQLATTAFAKSQDAVLARLPDQAVNMTAAASGSSGIVVADNDNIDFGTGDFTLVWRGSFPKQTIPLSASLNLLVKSGSYIFDYSSGSYIRIYVKNTASVGPWTTIADGNIHELVAVVTVGVTDTIINFYQNGILLGTTTLANVGDTNYSSTLYILGTPSVRTAGTCSFAATYNRALSAAEVLDLYRNGINYADKWGSQTAKYTSDFSAGVDGFAGTTGGTLDGNIDGIDGLDNWLRFTSDNANSSHSSGKSTCSLYKKYRISLKYYIPNSNTTMVGILLYNGGIGTNLTVKGTTTTISWEFTASSVTIGFYGINSTGGTSFTGTTGDVFYIKDIVLIEIGATLALEPEGIQPSPGQWLDSSTNKLHAMQPATGSLLTRKKDTFEIRWTNTWAGTHEAQYIGGVNQAVLPVGCYIDSIVGVITGTTVEDIIIGDGSDTDRWVALTTGLAAGTVSFTLANRISDGTNYKLVVDPDANFTGSIAFTITGRILQ